MNMVGFPQGNYEGRFLRACDDIDRFCRCELIDGEYFRYGMRMARTRRGVRGWFTCMAKKLFALVVAKRILPGTGYDDDFLADQSRLSHVASGR
jgi:hypothetical protein